MQIDNGTKTLLMNTSESRIVALDIGFARQRNKSCGIAHWDKDVIQNWNSSYGETISFLRNWPKEELHLIVEAPLFFVFDEQGNPAGRLPLEDPSHYWYLPAGVTVAFSVINLFRELLKSGASYRLVVYEGYMPHFGAPRQPHALDATELLAAARKEKGIVQYERSEFHGIVRTIHYYLGLPEPLNLPPIIEPL
jgi:hypothetical protein